MKKIIWLLRLGIVLFGAALVFESLTPAQTRSSKRSATTRTAKKHPTNTPVSTASELSAYDPDKVEAAQIWLKVKGPQVIAQNHQLHLRTFAAGDRVKPDSAKSAVYPHAMTQVYSDDPYDCFNSVTYTRNLDRTVTLTDHIPVEWSVDPAGSNYDHVVTTDTTNMLKPQATFTIPKSSSRDVVKLVQLMA